MQALRQEEVQRAEGTSQLQDWNLGEDQFGFRRGKGTGDAIGMMRVIAERILEIDYPGKMIMW